VPFFKLLMRRLGLSPERWSLVDCSQRKRADRGVNVRHSGLHSVRSSHTVDACFCTSIGGRFFHFPRLNSYILSDGGSAVRAVFTDMLYSGVI
jgi:hypothetical protein